MRNSFRRRKSEEKLMGYPRRILIASVVMIFVLFTGCLTGSAQSTGEFKFTTGFDYSSGDYGSSSDTDILYIPFTGLYATDRYGIKLTVPYLSIDSEETVVASGGQIIAVGGAGSEASTESGLGDILLTLSWYLVPESDTTPMVDLNGKVKFPTADEDKGLGTGETDYALDVDLAKRYGPNTAFGTLGYKIYGDPAWADLDNAFYLSAGMSRKFNPSITGGVYYDYREKTTDFGNDLSEITAYASYRMTEKDKLMVYGVTGLDDGSPDWGIGAMITHTFGIEELKPITKTLEKFRFW
jgi:hypothetical protein